MDEKKKKTNRPPQIESPDLFSMTFELFQKQKNNKNFIILVVVAKMTTQKTTRRAESNVKKSA